MLTEDRLNDIDKEITLVGRQWAHRYLNDGISPPTEQIAHEVLSLALLNQELSNEIRRLRDQLTQCEKEGQYAMMRTKQLEDQTQNLKIDLFLSQATGGSTVTLDSRFNR